MEPCGVHTFVQLSQKHQKVKVPQKWGRFAALTQSTSHCNVFVFSLCEQITSRILMPQSEKFGNGWWDPKSLQLGKQLGAADHIKCLFYVEENT
jgi:hypothetical protein